VRGGLGRLAGGAIGGTVGAIVGFAVGEFQLLQKQENCIESKTTPAAEIKKTGK
jgi:hypothetical protein